MNKADTAQYPLTIRTQNISLADYPFLNNLDMSRWNHIGLKYQTEISAQRCLPRNKHTNPKSLDFHVVGANKPVQHQLKIYT